MLLFLLVQQSCAQENTDAYPYYKHFTVSASKNNIILLHTDSYQQTTNYTCGPAVVMSLMRYYGMLSNAEMNQTTEMRIANEMGTVENQGTSQSDMVNWLEKHGFTVSYGQGISVDTIIDNLKRGVPTIVMWNDWTNHAMLVIGYQINPETLIFADPSTPSSITENQITQQGINTLTPNQLKYNWFNARYFFNPSHSATGIYIVAVPNKRS